MRLIEYKTIIESQYGDIKLPEKKKEIADILESIEKTMESVSIEDYHLFQAIMIIEKWAENEREQANI